MRLAIIPALAVLALSACDMPANPGGSQYLSVNGRRVVPLDTPGTFEVIAGPGDAGPQFFCAAADYAHRKLGARSTDRVVITRSAGDSVSYPGTRGVTFTLMSQQEAPPTSNSLIMNPRQLGESVTVGNGRHMCQYSDRQRSFR
ncbi:hypothetical protein [Mangrovicoccus sp. HB161399]|uniref:hypothetical protein n=1 Tax=Mangrovicoccus sp. HB161399 TaxID=2720392 RepID=UPI001556D266|nr:hypothetical protein [Mangrovicoccus sp. HB161399]